MARNSSIFVQIIIWDFMEEKISLMRQKKTSIRTGMGCHPFDLFVAHKQFMKHLKNKSPPSFIKKHPYYLPLPGMPMRESFLHCLRIKMRSFPTHSITQVLLMVSGSAKQNGMCSNTWT